MIQDRDKAASDLVTRTHKASSPWELLVGTQPIRAVPPESLVTGSSAGLFRGVLPGLLDLLWNYGATADSA